MARNGAWVVVAVLIMAAAGWGGEGEQGWVSLFDGRSLAGWRVGENAGTFKVADGAIVANGPTSHLFYTGPVENALFTEFELKVDVMTKEGSNGGMYFHTAYQESGWPGKGFEVQVNNSYRADPLRTGSLYGIQDVRQTVVGDDVWFTQHVIVRGNRVIVNVDGRQVMDWTAGDGRGRRRRALSSGTFALQGHDPGSTVYYRNIRVRPLPVIDWKLEDLHVHLKGGLTIEEAVADAQRRAVKFGVALNCGVGFPCQSDEGLHAFLRELDGQPVYKAIQGEGREWMTLVSREAMAKFDYIFTDSMTWTDDKGRRMRLWIPDEVFVDDKQRFMDMLVDRTVAIISNEPIDIYVNPTFLPAVIAGEYDALWTPERMMRVVRAAKEHQVAVEINSRFMLPSNAFILLCKAEGVKFTCGTNNGGRDDLGDLEYSKRMIRECGLTKEDFFTPRPAGGRAVDRWNRR